MIHPSGMRPPKGTKLKIKLIKEGLYAVENAYVGDAEYFPEEFLKHDDLAAETSESEKASDLSVKNLLNH